jgi:large subunit ribosomal protein L31
MSRSTLTAKETREVDGVEVPVVRMDISSVSHPFWTGTARELDADGKIDRFRRRYGGGKK